MDDVTHRHWEQIADRCFDRAYATAQNALTPLSATTTSTPYVDKHGHKVTTTAEKGQEVTPNPPQDTTQPAPPAEQPTESTAWSGAPLEGSDPDGWGRSAP